MLFLTWAYGMYSMMMTMSIFIAHDASNEEAKQISQHDLHQGICSYLSDRKLPLHWTHSTQHFS